MKEHGFAVPSPRSSDRYRVFDQIAREVADERVLYLEFGVSRGWSMRYWSGLLRHPEALLHGFDTFSGLPLPWLPTAGKGAFSTSGVRPNISDDRITYFVGLFEETLPAYEWPEYERLVVNIDADLYSSAVLVLSFIRERLEPGSYLYFDEFHHRGDEMRAFDEFVSETGMRFRLVGVTRELAGVAFRRE